MSAEAALFQHCDGQALGGSAVVNMVAENRDGSQGMGAHDPLPTGTEPVCFSRDSPHPSVLGSQFTLQAFTQTRIHLSRLVSENLERPIDLWWQLEN